jgi:hypothetical protein
MRSRGSGWHRAAGLLSVAMLFCCDCALARDKTDVITLRNGDRVTGEITKLEYGVLSLKTDDMGTISIEWDAITAVRSQYFFDVEQIGGAHLQGTLALSEETAGHFVVQNATGAHRLAPQNVTRIAQLESTFWSRINGAFSLGYNFAKSTDVEVLSAQFDATYRDEDITVSLGVDTNSSKTPDKGTLDRDSLSFAYRWLRPNRNFWAGLFNLERNEELGIDHRVQIGGGIGRYVYQTPHSEIGLVAGVAVNSEQATDSSENQESTEALFGASWRIWRLDSPKTSLASELALYPSLTEDDRYRGRADISLRHEVITDFFIDLSFYYDYDSEPLSETGDNEDYGITTSLGYSF